MAIENGLVQLRALSNSLHLLYHHNKNQHRQSKWWKWLTMLRRCVNKLFHELQRSQRERFFARLNYFRDILLPRCYGPFTQLIRDPQFSALGLVLVAELSEVKRLMHSFMEKNASIKEETAGVAYDKSPLENRPLDSSEDVGEIVKRAGQLPDMANFEAQSSKEFKSDARRSKNDMMDTEPPRGSALTSKKPQLSDKTPENAEDEERVILNHNKSRRHDDLNIIDRLFSGVI